MLKIISVCLSSLLIVACSGSKLASKNGKPLADGFVSAETLSDAPQSMNILIFGGTSGIGLQTVKLALKRGHVVTSVARRPERMTFSHARLSNMKGDITELESFTELVAGKDAVISAIGIAPTRKQVTVYSEGIKNVITAMELHNVDRLIAVSGIGAGNSKGHGGFVYDKITNPLLLKTDYQDKTRMEEIVKASQLEWTIVQPGFLTDEAAALQYKVIGDLEGITSGQISRADVAHYLLSSVENKKDNQQVIFISN